MTQTLLTAADLVALAHDSWIDATGASLHEARR
jgi:hypothetical protein